MILNYKIIKLLERDFLKYMIIAQSHGSHLGFFKYVCSNFI